MEKVLVFLRVVDLVVRIGVQAILIWIMLYMMCIGSAQAEIQHEVYLPLCAITEQIRHGAGATYGQCEYAQMLGLEWWYDWSPSSPECEGVESVPMIWGAGQVGAAVSGDSNWLMGFNEPGVSGQADLAPQMAAGLWRDVEELYPDKRLTTPCVLRLGWLSDWWSEYENEHGIAPRADAVCIHCYSSDVSSGHNAAVDCQRKMTDAIAWGQERGIGEVWVSEFAFLPCWGEDKALEYMRKLVDWFPPEVTRYAWFQLSYSGGEGWGWGEDCNTSLVGFEDGQLTPLGSTYRRGW